MSQHRAASVAPRALSSPCTMTMTPMVRVDRPQLLCHACALPRSSASNSMPNMREKFWPRLWLVPPCTPRPVAGTNASTDSEYSDPANFSAALFLPCARAPQQGDC